MCKLTAPPDGPPPPRASAIAALCLVSAAHAYSLAAFFSYAGFLAVDLHWAGDLDHSGVAVGMLGTALPLARIPFSMPWGMAVDRFGRRPCLIATALSLAAGQLLFPFQRHWAGALAVRFVLLGAGNGWPTIMGVICSELGGAARQTQIIGYVIGAGGVINLIGPGLGGLTYRLFGATFPALLPCLLGAALSLTAALATWLRLPETRPPPAARAPAKATLARRASADTLAVAAAEDDGADCDDADSSAATSATTTASASAPPTATSPAPAEAEAVVPLSTAMRVYPLPLLVLLRCVLGFYGFCLLALVPLWGIASREAGGLALDNRGIGGLLSLAAAGGLLWSTLGMARAVRRLGHRRMLISSSLLQLLVVPNLPRLQGAPFALIALAQTLIQCANATSFSCTIAAVNNVCARHPRRRGAVNGVMVTGESIAKAMGPGLGGPLYAFVISKDLPAGWPNGSILYFSGLGAVIAFVLTCAVLLPRSVDAPFAPEVAAAAAKGAATDDAAALEAGEEGREGQPAPRGQAKSRIWTAKAAPDEVPLWVAPAGGDGAHAAIEMRGAECCSTSGGVASREVGAR